MKFSDKCGTDLKCKENVPFFANYETPYAAALVNGSKIYLNIVDPNCEFSRGNDPILRHQCAQIDVDINGNAKPNKHGYDIFEFMLNKDNILPYGLPEMKGNINNSNSYFKETCSNIASGGAGCAAWVIFNENQEYLKCPGKLDWGGPTHCK